MEKYLDKPEGGKHNFRAIMLPAEEANLDAPLINAVRKRGGVWIPVTPYVSELEDLGPVMEDAQPGVWYWIET